MIFKPDHIMMLYGGYKTQTRRFHWGYRVGKSYAVQPGRGEKGLPDLRILIKRKWIEERREDGIPTISEADAKSEGGYTAEEYEKLYLSMYPEWCKRMAYEFEALISRPMKQEILKEGCGE